MTRVRTTLIALATTLALIALGPGTAAAQPDVANPGDFTVDIAMPGGGEQIEPDCKPALMTLALSGGTATCTIRQTAKAERATGTVANQNLVATTGDAGFATGTMTRTCDFDMRADMRITLVAGGGQPRMTMNGSVTMLCAWTMSFADARQSSLAGTMELNGRMAQGDLENQSTQGADIEMNLKVYVTSGTGLFEGYVGSGDLDQQQAMSLLGGNDRPTAEPPASSGPPASYCTAAGLAAGCTADQLAAACQANPAACASFSTPRAAAIRQAASGDAMTLKLRKAAGQVRIVAPLPAVGAKGGKAKVKATTRVVIVATKGAVCTARTNRGVLGTRTSAGSDKRTTVAPKRGAWKGATWVQATCALGGKSFSSQRVKVTL